MKIITIFLFCQFLFADHFIDYENDKVKLYLKDNKNFTSKFEKLLNFHQITNINEPLLQRGEYEYLFKNDTLYRSSNNGKNLSQVFQLNLDKNTNFGFFSTCKDSNFIAYTLDFNGDENYNLYIYNIKQKSHSLITQNIQKTIYCDRQDIYIQKQDKLYSIDINTLKINEIFKSLDFKYVLSFYPSADNKYLIFLQNNEDTSFSSIFDLKTKTTQLVKQKRKKFEYYVDIIDNKIFMLTQDNVNNIKNIQKASLNDFKFKEIYRFKKHVAKWHLFEKFIAFEIQNKYKTSLFVLNHQGKEIFNKQLNNDTQSAWLSKNDFAFTNEVKAKIQSSISIPKWLFINPITKDIRFKNAKEVTNYDESKYYGKLVFIDGLPISIFYNKNAIKANSPVYLLSYGAYFENIKRYFMGEIIALLDAGFIYAIAHIRGGNFLGQQYAYDGIGKNRLNAIDDLIKAAKYLKNYNNTNHSVIANAQSAGATILAAAINENPSIFKAAILQVPFLHVKKSLANIKFFKSIEYSQWGDLDKDKKIIDMYDPMQNIKKQDYPNLLVMSSKNDSRVNYESAVEYVKQIRQKSKKTKVLLHVNQMSGHQSSKQNAEYENLLKFTFILKEGLQ